MARILIGNIKGPQGAQGIQGPQGPVGATGPQGPMPDLINNALATASGVAALDAAMGKTLQDQITQLNSDILSLNSRLTNKKIVFNDEWIIGFSAYGSPTILIQIPLDNPDKKTPKLNITSAKIFTHAGWEDFTETVIMTVTETFIEISCSGHTPENIDIGNCCVIKLIGTIEI